MSPFAAKDSGWDTAALGPHHDTTHSHGRSCPETSLRRFGSACLAEDSPDRRSQLWHWQISLRVHSYVFGVAGGLRVDGRAWNSAGGRRQKSPSLQNRNNSQNTHGPNRVTLSSSFRAFHDSCDFKRAVSDFCAEHARKQSFMFTQFSDTPSFERLGSLSFARVQHSLKRLVRPSPSFSGTWSL